jgi:hypothetical protein
MPAVKLVGNQHESPVYVKGFPKRTMSANGSWNREEKFRIQSALVNDFLPDPNFTGEDGSELRSIEIIEQMPDAPGLAEVRIVYGSPDNDGAEDVAKSVNSITCESEAQRSEKNIEAHPDFNSLTDPEKIKLKENFSSFPIIAVTYRKITTKAKKKFKFTESTILGNVGGVEAPDGLKNADGTKWMNMGKMIRWTKGENVEITETWQYDKYAWHGSLTEDTDIKQLLGTIPDKT